MAQESLAWKPGLFLSAWSLLVERMSCLRVLRQSKNTITYTLNISVHVPGCLSFVSLSHTVMDSPVSVGDR